MRYVIDVGTVIPAQPPTNEDIMSKQGNRLREGHGVRGMFKASASTKKRAEKIVFEVWHVGKNDYKVVRLGVGICRECTQLGIAAAHARRMAMSEDIEPQA